MSLCYREQRQLRGVEAGLFRSDSHLAGMLEMFGRLYGGQDTPASEQVPSGQGRDRRAVIRITVAVAVAALALSILFSAALTTPARSGTPASGHRPPSPSTPGHAAKPTVGRTLPDRIASRGLACAPALAIAGFTRIVRWPLIPSAPKLAAEFSRAEGITIKLVIRGTSAGFADAR
jgi:hypothetical protein